MTTVIIRPYTQDDHSACMALFDSNVPKFFAASERPEFCDWLGSLPDPARPYLLIWQSGALVACGGLSRVPGNPLASLVWGMVDSARHRRGLGTQLTRARIDLARADPSITTLRLSTSQHSMRFYQGFGFVLSRVLPNGFAPGLDQYDMDLLLHPT